MDGTEGWLPLPHDKSDGFCSTAVRVEAHENDVASSWLLKLEESAIVYFSRRGAKLRLGAHNEASPISRKF